MWCTPQKNICRLSKSTSEPMETDTVPPIPQMTCMLLSISHLTSWIVKCVTGKMKAIAAKNTAASLKWLAKPNPESVRLIVVTGVSGAGRSSALKAFEDAGYYCVDNLPPQLVGPLCALDHKLTKVAVGLDVRAGAFLHGAADALSSVRKTHSVEIIFLDCSDDRLIQRFSESRRPHPLGLADKTSHVGRTPSFAPVSNLDVISAIQKERERLSELRSLAYRVIDTSTMSVHELRRAMFDHMNERAPSMYVRFLSFGFKYGVPVDSDLVFDVRFLPNPFFDPELKPLTGLDAPVSDFVTKRPEAIQWLKDVKQLLEHSLPQYVNEGKAYLTIAIGCTGGRHRSVAMTEVLHKALSPLSDLPMNAQHRDVGK